ncbi:hypothetical protein C6P46_005568 [Rhodotorula mucilaginosa]|uniref:DNA polymerase epsilon subunit D n=1 Tax=Rhodotorula mucilaginosa TaxID=5537 RepID=A0A9P6VXP3_RHOMI|nr:hypothetical protein C6P46_005568 [Rhodotorula mucilaginosa]TKA54331.1 hypothetical protein B0A53_03424 [Rhodotorula sp. CCFEE 5036]
MPRKKAAPAQSDPVHEEDGGLEAFELPKSVVARIARGALPDDIKLQKEVPLALVKGSTVFINYLAALSHDLAAEKNHKTISAAHVLDAVKQLGWDDGGELHRQLKKDLAGFRVANEAKKKGVAPPAPPPKAPKPTVSAPVVADPASNEAAAAVAEASTSAAAGEGRDEAATPVLRNERANADEADLYPGGEDLEEDDLEGVEEYVDEGEDDEMEDAGSEGIDDEEVADRGLEDDQDENDGNYREGQA